MGAMARNKGGRGERELAGRLSELLGFEVRRKLGAARDGGDDLEVGAWSVEVKRTERWEERYWTQCVTNAAGRPAMLAHRVSRQPWACYVDAHDVHAGVWPVRGRHRLTMTVEAWAQLAREGM